MGGKFGSKAAGPITRVRQISHSPTAKAGSVNNPHSHHVRGRLDPSPPKLNSSPKAPGSLSGSFNASRFGSNGMSWAPGGVSCGYSCEFASFPAADSTAFRPPSAQTRSSHSAGKKTSTHVCASRSVIR